MRWRVLPGTRSRQCGFPSAQPRRSGALPRATNAAASELVSASEKPHGVHPWLVYTYSPLPPSSLGRQTIPSKGRDDRTVRGGGGGSRSSRHFPLSGVGRSRPTVCFTRPRFVSARFFEPGESRDNSSGVAPSLR